LGKITNSEKQVRFRKKEDLKRYADKLFREYSWRDSSRPQEEIRTFLDKTTDLPFGWTNEDYERAVKTLNQFCNEFYDNPHRLENDVKEGRNTWNEFITAPDPHKLMKDEKEAIEKVQTLSAHIISALKLSGCRDSDQAAALMEAVRFVGRSLTNNLEVPKSQATAMCLASIGPQYDRPSWFLDILSNTIGWNLNKDLAQALGKQLLDFKYEHKSN